MSEGFAVVVGAGSWRSAASGDVAFPHRWTDAGVTVEAEFTGAHLLHLAVGGCVVNDVYREAAALAVPVDGVRVVVRGGFDSSTWASTGVTYDVSVDSPSSAAAVAALLERVDEVAEIPSVIR